MTVTDSAPQLGDMAGVPVVVEIPLGKEVDYYIHQDTHHGYCDATWLKTPHAEYGFRTRHAPFCREDGFEGTLKVGVEYRFNYNGEIIEKLLEF